MPKFFKKSDASNDDINPKEMETIMNNASVVSQGTGKNYHYVVLQVTLKEKFIGTGSKNLSQLEEVINNQAKKGYKLHTITTATGGSVVLVEETEFKRPWFLSQLYNKGI